MTDDEAAANGRQPLPDLATLGEDTAHDLVQLFKLLADETRLRIMYYLMQQDELNVRTLCRLLRQSQPAVSHHLALLHRKAFRTPRVAARAFILCNQVDERSPCEVAIFGSCGLTVDVYGSVIPRWHRW